MSQEVIFVSTHDQSEIWSTVAKSLTAQINEALCKVLCHNLCAVIQSIHELGIEVTFGIETSA